MRHDRGFTLLEVLVATLIMGIAIGGLLQGLSASSRNAARLTEYDRATLLARAKMDEFLADQKQPRGVQMQGDFDSVQTGGARCGWSARIVPFETVPNAAPGMWVVDRVEVEIWWMTGATRHSFSLEGFRRGILQVGDGHQ
jgi:general secretion pathway protein I